MTEEDTIAAISTPLGVGGIGIVRISGPRAVEIAEGIFKGKLRPKNVRHRRMLYGRVVDGDEEVDEVLLTVMRAPHTYTTEDVVEINCHGGMAVTRRVLRMVLERGARLARPGEFTMRAFLGGRMDLAQAEAVADIVKASSERARKAAYAQLSGVLSRRVEELRSYLVEAVAYIEASIDFPEDVELPDAELRELLRRVLEAVDSLRASYSRGRVEREGIRAVIVGRPNVGKSSLMNALLEEERAIVSEVPGTTRDFLDGTLEVDGLLVHLVDTAGIREAKDEIERQARASTERQAAVADLFLVVLDGSEPMTSEDEEVARLVGRGRKVIIINKVDKGRVVSDGEVRDILEDGPIVEASALTGYGLDRLKETMLDVVLGDRAWESDGLLITKERHKIALDRASEALRRTLRELDEGWSYEVLRVELQEALDALEDILGRTTPDEVLDRIFSEFCVGK